MSTSSYSASLRLRAISSTHVATVRDWRFGRVLPVMIPIFNMSVLLRCSGRSAQLLEQLNERRALGFREPARRQIHRRLVTGETFCRLFFARRCQPDDASPSVARVSLSCDEAARLEAIDSRGDRSTRELDATTDLIDRLRSLMKEHLHYREVGQSNFGRLDAARR